MLASIHSRLEKEYKRNELLYTIGGYIALFAHPLYWIIWTYVLPGFKESIFLRFGCAVIAIPVVLRRFWPKRIKVYFPLYWFFFLVFQLPITFTYLTLLNDFTGAWLVCLTMMVLLLTVAYSNLFLYFLNLSIGICVAYGLYYYEVGHHLEITRRHMEYMAPLPFALFCIIMCDYGVKKGAIEEKAELIKSLAGSIAHEMRNPFNSIHLSLHEIKSRYLELSDQDPVILKLIRISNQSIDNANKIITTILDNIKGKPIDVSCFIPLSFQDCIEIALDTYGYRSREKDRIILKIKEDFCFIGDVALFQYVIFNLIKNALYYSDSFPNLQISITSEIQQDANIVRIRDTGPGIPDDMLSSIFEDFISFNKKEGTGLGLPFCKRVMTSFNGSITCCSEVNAFTEFVLRFPKTDKKPIYKKTVNIDEKSLDKSLLKKRILIVDDEQTNCMLTKAMLKKMGLVNCDMADNGLLAIEKNKHQAFDLIFMDCNMPVMNGAEATKTIREDYSQDELPIVGLTGVCDEEIDRLKASGMNDILTKPVKCDDLLKAIETHLLSS